jgi:phosphatidate phosphatase APP1
MVKALLLFLALLSPSVLPAADKAYIVSGFDDVLRQANNTGLFAAAWKLFEKDQSFTGMPELYRVISREEAGPKFAVVSAISGLFDSRITGFLNEARFPERKLHLRNWLTEWSIEDFKIARMETLIREKPDRQFIVIFDNSPPSLAMVKTLYERFPGRIRTVYLHQILERENPEGATPYRTAFDVALNEHRLGRLSLAEINEVAEAILKETRFEKLVPAYAFFPQKEDSCETALAEARGLCHKVRDHLKFLSGHGPKP